MPPTANIYFLLQEGGADVRLRGERGLLLHQAACDNGQHPG